MTSLQRKLASQSKPRPSQRNRPTKRKKNPPRNRSATDSGRAELLSPLISSKHCQRLLGPWRWKLALKIFQVSFGQFDVDRTRIVAHMREIGCFGNDNRIWLTKQPRQRDLGRARTMTLRNFL